MAEIEVETAIIGGGQAGVPLARVLADAGRSVALIEESHLGGSCVNYGCTPTKALIASAGLASDARRAGDLGIRIPTVEVDFPAVMARVRRLVSEAKSSLDSSFEESGTAHVIAGHAKIAGRNGNRFTISAGASTVLAERIILDTGTRSAMPKIEGLDSISCIVAENWLDLNTLPKRLIVLGGSYIALEMAQAFSRLGAEVVVINQGAQLAEREDPDVAEALKEALEADGIEVRLNSNPDRVEATETGVSVHINGSVVKGTHLFVATGRKPNTGDLGLHTVGVTLTAQGMVEVDDRLATNVPGIWAVGDIRGGPAFTHTAYADFRVLQSLFLGDGSVERPKIIPYAMFTDPELGRVGMSQTEAEKAGRKIKVGRWKMSESGKAKELGKTAGFVKVLLDARTDEILGAAILSVHGSEVVQLFIELMNSGATAKTMRDAVHIHPTLAEAAKNALVSAMGE